MECGCPSRWSSIKWRIRKFFREGFENRWPHVWWTIEDLQTPPSYSLPDHREVIPAGPKEWGCRICITWLWWSYDRILMVSSISCSHPNEDRPKRVWCKLPWNTSKEEASKQRQRNRAAAWLDAGYVFILGCFLTGSYVELLFLVAGIICVFVSAYYAYHRRARG